MKLLGNLLMVVCLISGCLAMATAYRPRTTDAVVGLTQTAAAGGRAKTDAELAQLRKDFESHKISAEQYSRDRQTLVPIVTPSEAITIEQLEQMRTMDDTGAPTAQFVKVKEFSVGRWPFAWLFGLSALGLFTGAMLVRTATKKELAASALPTDAKGVKKEGDPAHALEQTRAECEQLLRDLPAMGSEKAQLDAIVERLGDAQKTHLADFVDARPRLIAKLGMSGYAELMDRFAAAERQINRAWSAAADGYLAESMRCLHNAPSMLAEAETKM
jgi:hypothetical protein